VASPGPIRVSASDAHRRLGIVERQQAEQVWDFDVENGAIVAGQGKPPTLSPAPRSVWLTPSIAASVAGWGAATVRLSDVPIWLRPAVRCETVANRTHLLRTVADRSLCDYVA
jgi:hypothetical protein